MTGLLLTGAAKMGSRLGLHEAGTELPGFPWTQSPA